MSLPAIGVDLLHLPRLRTLLSRRPIQRFTGRILAPAEREMFRRRFADPDSQDALRWLGGRWAAKEAVFKAMSPRRHLLWKEVEVRYKPSGQPYLWIAEPGAENEGKEGALSISHDGEYVVAMVALQP